MLHRPIIKAAAGLLVLTLGACLNHNWPAYRHDRERSGNQPRSSALSNTSKVGALAVQWSWAVPTNAQAFRSSPVVDGGRVYIGNGNGYFYALDAATGGLLWQFPAATAQPLTSAFTCNPSSFGIASSAVVASIKVKWFWIFKRRLRLVIFGAPDRSIPPGHGSGRLFALNARTGALVWQSPVLAHVTGTTWASTSELHEQIGYSAPVVSGKRVYVGIANHCDNPIQNGKVVAVDLRTGALVSGFNFTATGTRGGGIWSSPAADGSGLYLTSGNTRCWNGGCQSEPTPNHGLALLRLDPSSGALTWKLQPVPFAQDDDPDWAAGATLMRTSCGNLASSVMKDGWTYAVDRGSGSPGPASVHWQFPTTGIPFPVIAGISHGDTHYKKAGSAWGDVLFVETGGYARLLTGASSGYGKLHALNACAPESDRVRWILDVPGASTGGYGLGAPTVTRGIVYVGTSQGHVIAIADPAVAPAAGIRCSNTNYTMAQCLTAGYDTVLIPSVLANVVVSGGIWTEPALAGGKVFVATDAGRVYMLSP
jgi:outer membrane protein assembly factor BamB